MILNNLCQDFCLIGDYVLFVRARVQENLHSFVAVELSTVKYKKTKTLAWKLLRPNKNARELKQMITNSGRNSVIIDRFVTKYMGSGISPLNFVWDRDQKCGLGDQSVGIGDQV